MEFQKAINLISPASYRFERSSSWADLGCGSGLFTQALARLLLEKSVIYAVDSNRQTLNNLKPFEQQILYKLAADFIHDPLPLSELDGILMANALHFVPDQPAFVLKAQQWLKHDGCFLLVEYDTDTPDPWLPHPLSFKAATVLFAHAGFKIKKLGVQPSVFKRAGIYAALMER